MNSKSSLIILNLIAKRDKNFEKFGVKTKKKS